MGVEILKALELMQIQNIGIGILLVAILWVILTKK